ncbi:MAG: hypothetical protein QOH63_3483 [Acidobacteriota bacterium]|jgi:hypothetical protein|nr:hypothetical protein [Acidobacteriota bacterium]
MKIVLKQQSVNTNRRGERGAALVTTLLLATLLLTAGGALVLTTTLSATTAIDSTAEMQAYYGAEAGLQATINLLRGNVWNDSTTPVASFRSATEPSEANASGDSATAQNIARLSKWFTYDANNHIVVAGTSNLIAYDVTARDLDDSKNVRFSTSGAFDVNDSGCTVSGSTLTCVNGVNSFALTYTPQAAATLLAYPTAASSGLGSFKLVVVGNGANIPAGKSARFFLTINQTLPWAAKDTLIGTVSGDVNAASSNLKVTFSGSTVKTDGTKFDLCAACNPLSLNHSLVSSGVTALSGTITAPQPKRVLVRATGYGPKGAVKKLEMLLNQHAFDFDAPAVLTMRGADDCSAPTFDTGSSGAKNYSGIDNAGTVAQLPTFAVSGCNLTQADSGISKHNTVDDPELGYLDIGSVPAGTAVSTLPVQTPDFLKTADNARIALSDIQATAKSLNRYFTPATTGGSYTVNDSNTTPDGITFVDGNCNLDGGSGLLVVTGTLNMSGNPNFSGVILVLGTGSVNRDGGGNGNVYGALVVAGFDRNGTGGFTAPTFNTNGGGNSTMQYDSLAVSRAMGAVGTTVGGIREY